MRWSFILLVLFAFSFSKKFCIWIHNIFQLAKLFIIINDTLEGYFSCSCIVWQGDPHSPLIFGLVEDFFCRYLLQLADSEAITTNTSPQGSPTTSHLLYANDILCLFKGTYTNLKNIIDALTFYGDLSGQKIIWESPLYTLELPYLQE